MKNLKYTFDGHKHAVHKMALFLVDKFEVEGVEIE